MTLLLYRLIAVLTRPRIAYKRLTTVPDRIYSGNATRTCTYRPRLLGGGRADRRHHGFNEEAPFPETFASHCAAKFPVHAEFGAVSGDSAGARLARLLQRPRRRKLERWLGGCLAPLPAGPEPPSRRQAQFPLADRHGPWSPARGDLASCVPCHSPAAVIQYPAFAQPSWAGHANQFFTQSGASGNIGCALGPTN